MSNFEFLHRIILNKLNVQRRLLILLVVIFIGTHICSGQKSNDTISYYLTELINGVNGSWSEKKIETFIIDHNLKETILNSIPILDERVNTDDNKHFLFLTTAYLFYDVSEFKSTQELSMAALRAAERSGSKQREAATCNMIGNVFSELRTPDEAFFYFRKAITAMKATGNDATIGTLYNNFANAFYRNAENNPAYFDSCKKYNEMALELAIKYRSPEMEMNAYQSMALAETDLKHFAEAEAMLRRNIQIATELKDDISLYTAVYQLGRMYTSTGENSKADSAIKYLQSALVSARKFETPSMISEIFFQLSKAYYNKKEYKLSADYSIRFSEYNDSLMVIQNASDIGELSKKYESAKKEAMIKELNLAQVEKQEQINRQIYMILGSVTVLVFVVIVSVILFRSNQVRKKVNKELLEKNILIESQKEKVERQNLVIQEKNKEIIDSIRYAQRIQKALLPNEKLLVKIIRKNKES